ncbi:coenzyme F420-0:L-glutamate ligase [Patescibacteria group bacterium]|nr:coenzyme F420-0:L-glutamate ligase [Patescibacteria group bacterium]MBU1967169.1 coenzyme F420-0:L-glutamate ligase [Patescibacteria group bacterium]MBU2543321.1 coenzyme F420-0:L-glutamate ligase [Patescibacteria group bacterium]
MQVKPIQTPIIKKGYDLLALIRDSLCELEEKSIVVVTSKVVALCESRVAKIKTGTHGEKHALAKKEAEAYINESYSKYNLLITIKHGAIAVNAGIDQSNTGKYYAFLPKNPYRSAKEIWQFLRKEFRVKQLGVLITDSRTMPLKWGTVGSAIAHCGFRALINKIGTPDLFGRNLQMTQVNVAEGLAAAAVVEMGEANEAQPLAVITDASQVEFQSRPPTKKDIASLKIAIEDDVYGPMLSAAPWTKN